MKLMIFGIGLMICGALGFLGGEIVSAVYFANGVIELGYSLYGNGGIACFLVGLFLCIVAFSKK